VTALLTALGCLLLLTGMREVFATLFHPHGRGIVSERLIRAVARAARRAAAVRPSFGLLAGPFAFLAVVTSWGLMMTVGFALLFWAYMPEHFAGSAELIGRPDGFLDALYLSAVNITSLGYGDIVSTSDALRLLGTFEVIVGLGLLTASISFLVSIYGALSAYHSVSHEIDLLLSSAPDGAAGATAPALGRIASQLVATRRDLLHFPITYYFRSPDPRYALWQTMPRLLELTAAARRSDDPQLRVEAARADTAATDLLATLNTEFFRVEEGATGDLLAAFARDHP
jgi:hypothetical protein